MAVAPYLCFFPAALSSLVRKEIEEKFVSPLTVNK